MVWLLCSWLIVEQYLHSWKWGKMSKSHIECCKMIASSHSLVISIVGTKTEGTKSHPVVTTQITSHCALKISDVFVDSTSEIRICFSMFQNSFAAVPKDTCFKEDDWLKYVLKFKLSVFSLSQAGSQDTLNSIALKFNITPNKLVELNKLFTHTIVPGQVIMTRGNFTWKYLICANSFKITFDNRSDNFRCMGGRGQQLPVYFYNNSDLLFWSVVYIISLLWICLELCDA